MKARRGARTARHHLIATLILRRTLVAVPVLVLGSMAAFWLASLSPFDPLVAYLGPRFEHATPDQRAALVAALGLDDSWWGIWTRWAAGVVRGDLGVSVTAHRPVSVVLAERLPWTMLLGSVALVVAVVASLGLGVRAAMRPGGLLDRALTGGAHLVQGVPPFVLALLAVAVFAMQWRLLPVGGVADGGADPTWGSILRHLVLPAGVLALTLMPWFYLNLRTSLLQELTEDHVRAARAWGVPTGKIVAGHALPAALLPFVTVLGARIPEVVTGALLVESIFGWPGIASATVEAAVALDFPLLAAVTVLTCAVVLAGSLLADVLYLLLDPRVTHV